MALRELKGMTVLISGSTGLIGRALTQRLKDHNCRVVHLTTSHALADPLNSVGWDPENAPTFLSKFPVQESEIDAAVHLGGYPLSPWWTHSMKTRVYDSRVKGAKILTDWLTSLPEKTNPKRVLVSASAIGIYGTKPHDYAGPALNEDEAVLQGDAGFLNKVSRDSESACNPARETIRVVHPRFGLVMDKNGGVLKEMLLPFRLGLGGPIGSGSQFFPWVSLDDAVSALIFLLQSDNASGPFNVVSPGAAETSQKRFAQALGKALNRPAFIPLPGFILSAGLGREAAEAMLLGSIRIAPKRLLDAGFAFKDESIEPFLKTLMM